MYLFYVLLRHFLNCCLWAGTQRSELVYEPSKSCILVSYYIPSTFLDISTIGFQRQMLWCLLLLVRVHVAQNLKWSSDCSFHRWNLFDWHQSWLDPAPGVWVLHICMWPFLYISICRKFALLVFKSISVIVVLYVVVVLVCSCKEVISASSFYPSWPLLSTVIFKEVMKWKIFKERTRKTSRTENKELIYFHINTTHVNVIFTCDVFLFHISNTILREIIINGSYEEFILKLF